MTQNIPSLGELLVELDSENTSIAQEAQFLLEERGEEAIQPLLSVLPNLGILGQRCALDILASWPTDLLRCAHNPSIPDTLIPLLQSQDSYVREWSVYILGDFGDKKAVPEIEMTLAKLKDEGIQLDWTEAVACRHALTILGARTQIVPRRMAAQQLQFKNNKDIDIGPCWPATLLIECIESLSSENQVLLYYQAWQKRGNSYYWQETPQYEIDLTGSWHDIVTRSAEIAIATASKWKPLENTVVTLEWIGEADL